MTKKISTMGSKMPPKRDAAALRRLLSLPRDPIRLAAVDRMIEAKTPEARKEALEALEKLCKAAGRTKKQGGRQKSRRTERG